MEENNNIPDGWHQVNGENLFKVQGGYAFKSDTYLNEGILLVRIGNVGNGSFSFKDPIFVSKRFIFSHSNFLLNKDDVLMGLTGDLGKVCQLITGEFPYILNQRVGRFICSNKINNSYLFYLLSSSLIQSKFEGFFSGGAQKNISPKQIESIDYLIPNDIKEQNKIAEILSKVDKTISETETIIAKYNRIKTGLIQDLMTKGIDEKGNIRSEKTHEFKDSALGRIPKEWDCLELRKCIELHNNKRKPISAIVRAKMIGEFPYYGATGIIDNLNIYNVEGEFVLFGEDGDHFLKWKNQEQTILVNGKFNVSNHAHIVKGNHLCSTKWLHYFYFHRDITFYLTRQGAGRFKLNKESLSSLPILVPKDINEQIRIIDKIEYLNNFINHHKIQNDKLQATKTGLMQDLLSGKKRVRHLIN